MCDRSFFQIGRKVLHDTAASTETRLQMSSQSEKKTMCKSSLNERISSVNFADFMNKSLPTLSWQFINFLNCQQRHGFERIVAVLQLRSYTTPLQLSIVFSVRASVQYSLQFSSRGQKSLRWNVRKTRGMTGGVRQDALLRVKLLRNVPSGRLSATVQYQYQIVPYQMYAQDNSKGSPKDRFCSPKARFPYEDRKSSRDHRTSR